MEDNKQYEVTHFVPNDTIFFRKENSCKNTIKVTCCKCKKNFNEDYLSTHRKLIGGYCGGCLSPNSKIAKILKKINKGEK